MAKKKDKKEVKRLRKQVKKLTAANLTLEKRIRKLDKKRGSRSPPAIAAEASSSQAAPIIDAKIPPAAEIGADGGGSVASSQRAAWKRHSYLRDRYESHLANGATKQRARQLANDDLKTEYGSDSGYTEEELSAILS